MGKLWNSKTDSCRTIRSFKAFKIVLQNWTYQVYYNKLLLLPVYRTVNSFCLILVKFFSLM